MIFVTVGSTDFDALIRAMDEIAGRLDEPVVMQIGSGKYLPVHAAEYFRYALLLDPYYDRAEVIVSHGGLGTIMEAIHKGKRLVAVSNPDRYDAHQEDILGFLAAGGHLIWCRELDRLADELQGARAWEPVPLPEPECRIHLVIHEFLQQRRARRGARKRTPR